MSSLREVKDRIASVKSTLKITSAMKLVASSKLRKAQKAIEALRPYEEELYEILRVCELRRKAMESGGRQEFAEAGFQARGRQEAAETGFQARGVGRNGQEPCARQVIIAIASNTSLCGGFNTAIIKKAMETVTAAGEDVEVWSLGRKMAEAMKKAGHPSPEDCTAMVAHPSYEPIASLARTFLARFEAGEISGVTLVYSHFVSSSRQTQVCEKLLPMSRDAAFAKGEACGCSSPNGTSSRDAAFAKGDSLRSSETGAAVDASVEEYIIEPGAETLVERLLPQVLSLKLYAAILDSAAAEHAARTIAMQTASDNAKDLIADLTLEYNKGRQQKITSEILDLVAGAQK